MTSDIAFWDKMADGYSRQPIADMAAYEYTLNRTRSHLGANDRVLELGAGTGGTARLLAPGVAHVTATDLSPNMTAIGRTKAADEGISNVTFRAASVEEALADETLFDAVLALNLLHLLHDPEDVAKKVHARLKPGGLFISKSVCLPVGRAPLKFTLIKAALPIARALGKAPYVNFMRIDALEAHITRAGFDIIETGNYPANPPNRYIVARKK